MFNKYYYYYLLNSLAAAFINSDWLNIYGISKLSREMRKWNQICTCTHVKEFLNYSGWVSSICVFQLKNDLMGKHMSCWTRDINQQEGGTCVSKKYLALGESVNGGIIIIFHYVQSRSSNLTSKWGRKSHREVMVIILITKMPMFVKFQTDDDLIQTLRLHGEVSWVHPILWSPSEKKTEIYKAEGWLVIHLTAVNTTSKWLLM